MTVGRIPVIEGGIQPTIFDAKADLLTATANDTPARLAVGANGTMLVANSAESTGLKWTTATDQFPWTTYTPTYNGIIVGNGAVVARYSQIGKTVNVYYSLTFGSTTSLVGSLILITMPVAASANYIQYNTAFGIVKYTDAGAGEYTGFTDWYNNSFGVRIMTVGASGTYTTGISTSPTVPFTFGTADCITFSLTYEAA
jgi:hypothetical protein